jgi:hypothetical protein
MDSQTAGRAVLGQLILADVIIGTRLRLLFARVGFQAMKDPDKPLGRSGGYRVFAGTALMTSGPGMSVVDLVVRWLDQSIAPILTPPSSRRLALALQATEPLAQ